MGNKIQKTIEINAKVKTSLEGMEKTVSDLEKGLEKQKFDLSKNSGLSKLIKDYKEAKAELDELMSGDVIARTDIRKAEQLGGKVSRLYKQIGKSFEDLRAGSDDTFRKLFPDSFTAKISKGTKAIENFFSKLDSKTVKEGRLDEARKDLTRLGDELDELKNRRLKVEIEVDRKSVKNELDRINKDLEQMRENFKKKLIPEEKRDAQGRTQTERLNSSVSTWSNKLTQDLDARRNLKVQSLSKSQSSQISKLEGQLVDAQGASLADIEKKRLAALHAEQTKRATIAKTPGARDTTKNRREYGGVTDKELAAQIAASEKEIQRLRAIVDKIDDIKQQPQRAYDAAVRKLETQIKTDRTNLEKAEKALEAHTTQRENQEAAASQKADDFMAGKQVAEATQAETDALKALNDEKQKNLDLEKKLKEEKSFDSQKTKDSAIAKKDSSIEKKKLEIQELENTIKNLANDTDFDAIFKKLQELGVNTDGIDKTRAGLEGIKTDLESLDENTLKEIREALKQMGVDAKDTDAKVDTLAQGMEQLGDTDKDLKRAETEMENLKNQVLDFFSLTNAIELFKRAVTSALNTVKELDKTMTEAAVVTDFNIGDMWDKLPQYSAEAQKLGVSINGMYQATTLYYQQGLKTNEAMQLGVETMKMGKIAAMDSTEATKAMTAALRGFNMELNETSAVRVNDVYSQLAAVTAADTNQIATAMAKTASIAASANMEFETTAALLAQIIETTQEAPETAGTAMKTIIARFAEVKSLREQGQTTGIDSEGEVIDVNKIQAALRTVGISMDGFFAGTEGLDSVLLKLSEKWDTLDFETQRYIATMAAGSRQQSRFIAMMSGYERTMELVSQAQNSAGASQRQFEKTQDSLETSIQKLKNAWNEFLMGLANNEVLKFAIDSLTFIIEGINKVIDAISGGNGLIKSITSLIGVIGALKIGKKVLGGNLFSNFLGGLTGKRGQTETIDRKTTDVNGNVVEEHIVRNPQQQGDEAGYKAGTGFMAGFKRATEAGKKGENKFKAFFTTKSLAAIDAENKTLRKGIRKKYETPASEGLVKRYKEKGDSILGNKGLTKKDRNIELKTLREDYLGEIQKMNSFTDEQMEQVKKAYYNGSNALEQYEKSMSAANEEVLRMGGTLMTAEQQQAMYDEQMKKTTVDLGAMGQAAMGVSTALGLLGAFFEAVGWEEGAEVVGTLASVFMGLGSVLSVLPSLISGVAAVATAAGISVQAAWWWVVLIVAAVTALIVGFVALGKAAKKASLSGQMEAAKKQADSAADAAQKASDAYTDLVSQRDEYRELQDTLSNLTKGTLKWREALIEANAQVLELLKTYPQLAQYITRGEDGQLQISEQGWDQVLKEQYEATQRAQAATLQAKAKESKLQQKMLQQEKAKLFENEWATRGYYASMVGGALVSQAAGAVLPGAGVAGAYGAEKIASNVAETNGYSVYRGGMADANFIYESSLLEELSEYNELFGVLSAQSENQTVVAATNQLAEQFGKTTDEITSLSVSLNSLENQIEAVEIEKQIMQEEAMRARVSEDLQESEYADSISKAYAKASTSSRFEADVSEAAKTYSAKNDKARIEEMQKRGINHTGDDLKDLQLLYKDMYGLASTDDISEDIKNDKEALAEAVARGLETDGLSAKMNEMIKHLDSQAPSQELKVLTAVLGGDTSGLTFQEISALAPEMPAYGLEVPSPGSGWQNEAEFSGTKVFDHALLAGFSSAEEYLSSLGYEDTMVSKFTPEEQEAYWDWYVDSTGVEDTDIGRTNFLAGKIEAENLYNYDIWKKETELKDKTDKAKNELSNKFLGTNISGLAEGLMGEDYLKLVASLRGMQSDEGSQFVEEFLKLRQDPNLTSENRSKLDSVITSTNWGSMSEALNALEQMQSLGLDSSTIEEFWKTATAGAETFVHSIAEALTITERFVGKLESISSLEKRITEGKGTYEDVQQLVEAGVDISNFQLTPEGWKATEEQIAEATKRLKEYNAQQAKMATNQHKQQIQENTNILTKNGFSYDASTDTFEKTGDTEAAINKLTSVTENGALVAGQITGDSAIADATEIATAIGIDSTRLMIDGVEESDAAFVQRIQQGYNDFITGLNNGKETGIILEKTEAFTEAARYSTDEAVALGHSDESVRYSMMNEAAENGLDSNEVVAYSDSLMKEIPGLEQKIADQIAIDNAKMNQGVKELSEGYDELAAAIEAGPGDPKYASSVDKLRASATKLLGSTEGLSDSWLTNDKNMALFKKAAAGNVDAIEELRKEAAKELVLKPKITEDGIDATEQHLLDMINSFDGESVEIGTSLNDTALYDAFNDMIAAGKMTAGEVQDALDKIGFEPEYETETYTVTDQDVANGSVKIPRVDAEGNVTYVDEPITSSMTAGSTITIPKIVGKNSDGSGGHAVVTGTYRGSAHATASGAPKSGGGGGGSNDKWENPYDKLHNELEEINDLMRERTRLEREFQRLTRRGADNYKEIQRSLNEQIKNQESEIAKQQNVQKGREEQIAEELAKNPEMQKYIQVVTNPETGDKSIRIDWEAINKITDQEQGEKVSEFYDKIKGWLEDYYSAEESIAEGLDAIYDLFQQGKDAFLQVEQQVKDALIDSYQKQIDELSNINDSINDTNSKILDSMQKQIDEYRRNRENEETEEEIANKQRKLAYLQQDTSGANAVEILQLQKEIEESQEDYTDTLIDQKISELQEQNDFAAEQRERQIEIAQAQLDQYAESDEIWQAVGALIADSVDKETGEVLENSPLMELLKETNNFVGMSKIQQMDWMKTTEDLLAMGIAWLTDQGMLTTFFEGKEIQFTTADGQTLSGKVDGQGKVTTSDGKVYSGVHMNEQGQWVTDENYQATEKEESESSESKEAAKNPYGDASKTTGILGKGSRGNQVKSVQWALWQLEYLPDESEVDGKFGSKTHSALVEFQKDAKAWQPKIGYPDGKVGPQTREAFRLKQYKTGGLADFTGPAWLDGTKSKPEYILNADQTKAFFTLIDVLSGLQSSTSKSTEKTGDNTYDIDINVESIGSDYDVEQLAETVKRLINDDARYRNNNAINLMR